MAGREEVQTKCAEFVLISAGYTSQCAGYRCCRARVSAKNCKKTGAGKQQRRLTCSGAVRRRCVVAQMQGEVDFGPVVFVVVRSQTGVLRGFLINKNCGLVLTEP